MLLHARAGLRSLAVYDLPDTRFEAGTPGSITHHWYRAVLRSHRPREHGGPISREYVLRPATPMAHQILSQDSSVAENGCRIWPPPGKRTGLTTSSLIMDAIERILLCWCSLFNRKQLWD